MIFLMICNPMWIASGSFFWPLQKKPSFAKVGCGNRSPERVHKDKCCWLKNLTLLCFEASCCIAHIFHCHTCQGQMMSCVHTYDLSTWVTYLAGAMERIFALLIQQRKNKRDLELLAIRNIVFACSPLFMIAPIY